MGKGKKRSHFSHNQKVSTFDASYKDILFSVTPCQQEHLTKVELPIKEDYPAMTTNDYKMTTKSRPCSRSLHLDFPGFFSGLFQQNGC